MIDLHFPLVMFKKLLNEKATLEDFIELNPTEGRSLQDILDYDRMDFEETFMLNFVVSFDIDRCGFNEQMFLIHGSR